MDTRALQIIGLLIASLGLVTSIMFWLAGRNRKGIGYEVLSIDPLIEKKSDGTDKLEIHFGDRLVEEPHIVRVRICNAERTTIRKDEFKRPITLSFGGRDVSSSPRRSVTRRPSRPSSTGTCNAGSRFERST